MAKLAYGKYLGSAIRCPVCGDEGGLHQRSVAVYNRKEDGQVTAVTHMSGSGIATSLSSSFTGLSHHLESSEGVNNPSPRRQGIRISFECEHCTDLELPDLLVFQHKGATLVEWEEETL